MAKPLVKISPLVFFSITDAIARSRVQDVSLSPHAAAGSDRVGCGVLLGRSQQNSTELFTALEWMDDKTTDSDKTTELLTNRLEQYCEVWTNTELMGWYTVGGNVVHPMCDWIANACKGPCFHLMYQLGLESDSSSAPPVQLFIIQTSPSPFTVEKVEFRVEPGFMETAVMNFVCQHQSPEEKYFTELSRLDCAVAALHHRLLALIEALEAPRALPDALRVATYCLNRLEAAYDASSFGITALSEEEVQAAILLAAVTKATAEVVEGGTREEDVT